MDRYLELRIKSHLYELGTINDEVLGTRQGFHAAERGRSAIERLREERTADKASEEELRQRYAGDDEGDT